MPQRVFSHDELASDGSELNYVLELSLAESISTQNFHSSNAEAGPSQRRQEPAPRFQKATPKADIAQLDAEIADIDGRIEGLQALRTSLVQQRQDAERAWQTQATAAIRHTSMPKNKGKGRQEIIDYNAEFEWTGALRAKMQKIFGIRDFRLCQQAVCNANMDRRDIVCVMPTGGGKSLTYQLPALLTPGCTVVISPLIALMTDQVLHLREARVNAVMITHGTPAEEKMRIFQRLKTMASSPESSPGDIKLVYVTPEMMVKGKKSRDVLQLLVNARKLDRFVIDEGHCVSQYGHDFRPDYQKLTFLRKLFPAVPIMALSATCPPAVLHDIRKVLKLKPITPGPSAPADTTIYFSAPLYRKNLRYSVLPKPSSSQQLITAMKDYILGNHRDHTGIIYCMSRKDAEDVATKLMVESGQEIKTGVYHADIGDRAKELIHTQWRKGEVKVVCATTAFGLGIDKGDVRFVLHHSVPTSLDSLYQETGRAGRDGKDADCVLYYRPQDAIRLYQITSSTINGTEKVQAVLQYAQDLEQCRKLQFARYFSTSADVEMAAWTTAEEDAETQCGRCDNCTRAAEQLYRRDIKLVAWRVLKAVTHMTDSGRKVTVAQLADLVRRRSKAVIAQGNKRKKADTEVVLDMDDVAGGIVEFSREDTELLCIHLLLEDYLQISYGVNAHTINVYVVLGANAARLMRISKEAVERGMGPAMFFSFPVKSRKPRGRKNTNETDGKDRADGPTSMKKGKGRVNRILHSDDDEGGDEEDIDDDSGFISNGPSMLDKPRSSRSYIPTTLDSSDEDMLDKDGWSYSIQSSKRPIKRPRRSCRGPNLDEDANIPLEVICISSD